MTCVVYSSYFKSCTSVVDVWPQGLHITTYQVEFMNPHGHGLLVLGVYLWKLPYYMKYAHNIRTEHVEDNTQLNTLRRM